LTAMSAADAGATATVIAAKLTAAANNFLIAMSPFLQFRHPTMRTLACKSLALPAWRIIRVERDARNRMATLKRNSYERYRALFLIARRRLVVAVFISEPSVDL
jgi:hypothetical protein